MPKRKLTPNEKGDQLLVGLIEKGLAMRGEKYTDVCVALGFQHPTYYRRLKNPQDFTLRELRYFVQAYSFTLPEVACILAMPEQLSDSALDKAARSLVLALKNELLEVSA